ncbi:MAG TPA: hypothetical protein VKE40_21165 [Gemmataceae bacterium]|nr:hypothetical protein [Gemmataceae bacterium]
MRQILSGFVIALVLAGTPVPVQAGRWNDPSKPDVAANTQAEIDRKLTYMIGIIAAGVAAVAGYQFRRELAEMVSRRRGYRDEDYR